MSRRIRLASAVLGACCLLIVASTVHAKRVALVIGNSAYEAVGVLPNPANDAEATAATLERMGSDSDSGGGDVK